MAQLSTNPSLTSQLIRYLYNLHVFTIRISSFPFLDVRQLVVKREEELSTSNLSQLATRIQRCADNVCFINSM